MSQGTDRDEVHATLGIVAQGVERDATRRFRLVATTHHLDGLTSHLRRKVVEHDTIHATQVEYLLEFVEVAHFDFYLQILALGLAIFLGTGDGLVDAACKST